MLSVFNKGIITIVAVVVIAVGIQVVGAQFISPTCVPPSCNPQVIQNIASTDPAQTASINISGDVKVAGCFGATYTGSTASLAPDQGSYAAANSACDSALSGSHVCTIYEIVESIKCGETLPASPNIGWVIGGPPGFTAQANDCEGWTDATGSVYGRVWQFNGATGGSGTMTTCSAVIPFACYK